MRGQFLVTLLFVCGWMCAVCAAASVQDQCQDQVNKVTPCLPYATGKGATPAKECCSAATEIKNSNPVCLCYLIQVAHNGSAAVKSLGIQEARLLQLPSACKLTNASISDCPKLLNLPPGSPDYAIFTNSSTNSSSPPTTTTASPSTTDGSNGFKHGPNVAGPMAIAMAIFFSVFPAGFASARVKIH